VLERLVLEKADVVVQNLAPGAAPPRPGLRVLAAKKPAIIVCDISGYGADGPYRDKKAYDLLIQSAKAASFVLPARPRAEQGGRRCRTHPRRHDTLYNILGRALQRSPDRARASTSTSRC
jgi:hypothetical protein